MQQLPKSQYSYFSYALEFIVRVLFLCEYPYVCLLNSECFNDVNMSELITRNFFVNNIFSSY